MTNESDDTTTLRAVIISQYLSALEMLRQTILNCPESFWRSTTLRNQLWRVAYHALFYVHLYLQPSVDDFVPWHKHRNEVESYIAAEPEQPDAQPYSREDVLEYLDYCTAEVRSRIAVVDFSAPSGFPWYPITKLELQFVNIRHIQQHTGELSEQLSDKTGNTIRWVGFKHAA